MTGEHEAPTGEAHVATVSFLASRAVPTGGFFVALAGGVALARVAALRGARQGYGASVAAMLETVAIMGPARFTVPLTQALTAPMNGRQQTRGHSPLKQVLACAAIRLVSTTIATAFFIWVVTGGLDAYAGAYSAVTERVGIDLSDEGALVLTAAGLIVWAAFASVVQVGAYIRGLKRWPETVAPAPGEARAAPDPPAASRAPHAGRFDPRAVALAAVIAFGALLASTEWAVIGAVAAWLALATVTSRPDGSAVPTGLILAALLGLGALSFSLVGGLGADVALRRAARAVLLVLVATWLRAAAGSEGLREVFRRVLGRARRVPGLSEASGVLDTLDSERRLVAAGRSLAARLRAVRPRPLPVLDAVLDWVAHESGRFRPAARATGGTTGRPVLRMRPLDVVLVVLAAATVGAVAL